MTLPGPSSGIRWDHYRNVTPTFNLTPIEKPDSSLFLVHMTGKSSLIQVLKGEGVPAGTGFPPRHGFIKSSIPMVDVNRWVLTNLKIQLAFLCKCVVVFAIE